MRSKFYPLMAKRFQIEMVRDLLRKACDPLSTVSIFHQLVPQFKFKQKVKFIDEISDPDYTLFYLACFIK